MGGVTGKFQASTSISAKTPEKERETPLLASAPSSATTPKGGETPKAQIETAEILSMFRKSRGRSNASDASIAPLDFEATDEPIFSPTSMKALGKVISKIKERSVPKVLSDDTWKPFHHKMRKFPLPDAPTCITGLNYGFAVGLENGVVLIVQGTLSVPLGLHDKAVTALASCSDDYGGAFLVSGSKDGAIEVWHLGVDKEERIMSVPSKRRTNPVKLIRVAKDKSFVIASFEDNSLVLLNLSTHESKAIEKTHEEPVAFLEISPSSKWFVTAPAGNALKLWSLPGGTLQYTLTAKASDGPAIPFQDPLEAVYVFSDSLLLLFGIASSAAAVRLRNANIDSVAAMWGEEVNRNDRPLQSFVTTHRQISIYGDMKFSSKEVQQHEETVWMKVVPRETGATCLLSKTPGSLIFSMADLEITFGVAGAVCETSVGNDLLGVATEKDLLIFRLHDNWSTNLAVPGIREAFPSNSGSVLVSTDRHILKINPYSESGLKQIHNYSNERLLGFSPDGRYVLLDTDTEVQFLSMENGLVEKTFEAESCQAAAVSPKGEFLFMYDRRGVRIWSLLKNLVIITFPSEGFDFVNSIVFSADDNFVATMTSKRTLLWDLRNQTLVIRYSQTIQRNGLFSTPQMNSLQGIFYLEFGIGMNMSLFGVNVRRRVLESSERTSQAVLCKNDRYCLILRNDVVVVLEFPTLIPIAELGQKIESFTLFSDKETLLTSGASGMSLWQVTEGRMVSRLPYHGLAKSVVAVPATTCVLAHENSDNVDKYFIINAKWYMETAVDEETDIDKVRLHGADSLFDLMEAYSLFEKLINTGTYNPQLSSVVLIPHKLNSLHMIAFMNSMDSLPPAFKSRTPVIRGVFGSPLTVAIQRKTRRCLEALIKYIISLKTDAVSEFVAAIHCISDDVLDLIKIGSNNLMGLFKAIVMDHVQGAMLSQFISPRAKLPIGKFSDSMFISPQDFGSSEGDEDSQMVFITFHICILKWNFEMGSSDSIILLKALANSKSTDILKTKLVSTFVSHKWKSLWLVIFGYTMLYFLMLILFVLRVFNVGPATIVCRIFWLLNVFFLIHEGFQAKTLGWEYLRDLWNYIDIFRGTTCIVWILMSFEYPHLSLFTWVVAVLCFLRGLTHFRAFSGTRFYVRMVLDVIKQASTFIILFFYTTFSFGILYVIASPPEEILHLQTSWVLAYELDMGHFDSAGTNSLQWLCFMLASLINIVVMLNLLVSILGDAFERVQARNVEADVKEMIDTVLEYESLMVWKRASGQKQFIQLCTEGYQEEAEENEWKGRASAIKKKITRMTKQFQSELRAATDEMTNKIQQNFAELKQSLTKELSESKDSFLVDSASELLTTIKDQILSVLPAFLRDH